MKLKYENPVWKEFFADPAATRCTAGGACLLPGSEQSFGPGHNSLTTGPDGETYVVYHAWDKAHTARHMCIDPLVWEDGVPRCDGPKSSGVILTKSPH